MVCFAIATAFAVPAFAQAPEDSESHAFPDTQPPPPTPAELARAAELSEKYVEGRITEEELTELKTYQSDLSTLDGYRAQFQNEIGTVDGESNFEPAAPNASRVISLPASNTIPLWLLIMVVSNTIGTVGLFMLVMQRNHTRDY